MYVNVAVRLVKDPRTQRPKGFGFIKYAREIDAKNALKAMNGRVIALLLSVVMLHLIFVSSFELHSYFLSYFCSCT